ncbi:MAG: HAD family hydrolase [Candidatus Omnitrophota bacterium]
MIDIKVDSRELKDIALMIFDKDGTLMDLYHYWSNMVGYRVELAGKKLGFNEKEKPRIMYAMGVDLACRKLRSEGPVGIRKREVVMAAMEEALSAIGFKDTRELCLEVFKEADAVSIFHLQDIIRPIRGMTELINGLHSRGCRIGLATTDKTRRAELALGFLGIKDKVDIIIGEDMVGNYKPHPDMVNLILEKLAIDKRHAVMVGDAVTDIEMGNNAGLKASIAVLSGIATREQFAGKTTHIVPDISYIDIM